MAHASISRDRKRRVRQSDPNRRLVSGADWVHRFPHSRDVEDLVSPFREGLKRFLSALSDAGAVVSIATTYRPAERAYLMHYAWRIAREGLDPRAVPMHENIDIEWVHRRANNRVDLIASRKAAEDMIAAYGIVYRPALNSQHTRRLAIDMTISWRGDFLLIRNFRGSLVRIEGAPRSGQNARLHAVGATYGVIKLVSDPPHWSSDGS